MKPYAEACDRNRDPILAAIGPLLRARRTVLEIGSGTGQHAVYFAQHLPQLHWQTSDRAEYLPGIRLWLAEAGLANLPPPLALDVGERPWPAVQADAVFSANTTHIMHWPMVEAMFVGVGALLPAGGLFMLYGPFNYGGEYTSASNARFDAALKARDPRSGIRNLEDLDRLAAAAGLRLDGDIAMPANNRLVYWQQSVREAERRG